MVPLTDYEVEAGDSCEPCFLKNIEKCQKPADFDLLSASREGGGSQVPNPKNFHLGPESQKTCPFLESHPGFILSKKRE